MKYSWMLGLDEAWAVEHRSDFFPKDSLTEWREAFGNFLRFNRPHGPTFEILREEFDFALQHLDALEQPGLNREDPLNPSRASVHLLPVGPISTQRRRESPTAILSGTDDARQRWQRLFDHVGFLLRNTNKNLEDSLKARIISFFEWRLEVGDATELGNFGLWLKIECLEVEWRLDAYDRLLDVFQDHDSTIVLIETDALVEMLPEHTEKVVECFAKLTDRIKDAAFHIRTETAKRILKAGLESSDQGVRDNAARARDNLLRRSRFDLLDLS